MKSILSIKNLTLKLDDKVFFADFNLEIEENSITSIIAPNRSGKSLLTKLIAGIIPTNSNITVDDIILNRKNVLDYITKIGIVTNDLNQEFLFKKVKDELAFPLLNLGYPEHKINKRVLEIANYFEFTNLLNKQIIKLTTFEKQKLLIALSLIHKPKILILDDAFLELNNEEQSFLLKKLKELTKENLTILNITSKLDTTYLSNRILILNNFKIIKDGTPIEIFSDNDYLKELGFNIPFLIDVSNKLKFYNLIDKVYFDLQELEGVLWK